MNKQKFASLPPDIRAAIDAMSNETLVDRFGQLWNKWDKPVRDGAAGSGQTIINPDAATLAEWRVVLNPATVRYLDTLVAGGFADARTVYNRLAASSSLR
jgi:TRAP-type C4-dicarboxylate transport system substrate-binding protein